MVEICYIYSERIICMQTRVDKYKMEESSLPPKRSAKNVSLYEEIKKSELDNFNIGSNAKVIADNDAHMDIEKIKEILEKNYQEVPKQRSMKFEMPEEEELPTLEETKEYDINAILDQAREEKETDYQKERLKKIRDTQYDILKNLELEAKQKESASDKTKEELLELINTININEAQSKNGKKLKDILEDEEAEETDEMDPLDILTELKGDDGTIVAGAKEFTDELQKFEVDSLELKMKNRQSEEQNDEDEDDTDSSLDDSIEVTKIGALEKTMEETSDDMFDSSETFTSKDFADIDTDDKGSIVIKILIVVVFIAIVAGLVIFLNDFLNLGWF